MTSHRRCLGLAFACAAAVAGAAERTIEVSRAEFNVQEPGWSASKPGPFRVAFDSGNAGWAPGESRRLVLRDDAGRLLAAFHVRASKGHVAGSFDTLECPLAEDVYVRDFNHGVSSRWQTGKCLRMDGVYKTPMLLSHTVPVLDEAPEDLSKEPDLPRLSYRVWAYVSNEFGTTIWLDGAVASNLMGLPDGEPASRVPEGMPRGVAVWADALAEALLGSIMSMGGRVDMPTMRFEPEPAK